MCKFYLSLQLRTTAFSTLVKMILVASTISIFAACAEDEDATYFESSEFFYQLTEEDQRRYAPSPLFRSIYQNNEADFDEALESNKDLLVQKNFEQDTPLAVAIRLKRFPMIPQIIERMTLEEMKTPNAGGRSFISLLAEIDDVESFEIIQRRYSNHIGPFKNLQPGQYFTNYDFVDEQGRNAAHYAQSKIFLDQLATTWFYRTIDATAIWSDLFWQQDAEGRTFIHQAARYNKFDVIQWYTEAHCGSAPWEGEWMVTRAIDSGFWLLGKGVQFLQEAKYAPLYRKLINTKDEAGNTALHIAAINGSYESVRALLRCQELNPTSYNDQDQIPMTALLSQLDMFEDPISEDFKLSFKLLLDQINPQTVLPTTNFRYFVNAPDLDGQSAVFYASRLADRYFIEILEAYDLGRASTDGISPSDGN